MSSRNIHGLVLRASEHYEFYDAGDPSVQKSRSLLTAASLAACLFFGCDSQGAQDDFARDASAAPSGFVRTDDGTEILADDLDDWRTAPIYAGKISIRPAYPNPAAVDDFVTVPFSVTAFNEIVAPVQLKAVRDADRSLLALDSIDRAADPGTYAFTFSAARLGSTGLHRLFIFDAAGELVSYGDLMVE